MMWDAVTLLEYVLQLLHQPFLLHISCMGQRTPKVLIPEIVGKKATMSLYDGQGKMGETASISSLISA